MMMMIIIIIIIRRPHRRVRSSGLIINHLVICFLCILVSKILRAASDPPLYRPPAVPSMPSMDFGAPLGSHFGAHLACFPSFQATCSLVLTSFMHFSPNSPNFLAPKHPPNIENHRKTVVCSMFLLNPQFPTPTPFSPQNRLQIVPKASKQAPLGGS